MPPVFKRKRTDADGHEVSAGGRARVADINVNYKIGTLRLVYNLARKMYAKALFDPLVQAPADIAFDIQLFNVIFSLYQADRQSRQGQFKGGTAKFHQQKAVTIKAHGLECTYTVSELRKWYEEERDAAGLTPATRDKWNGNAQAIMCLLALFGERFKEVRFTPTGITVGKDSSETEVVTKTVDFRALGVNSSHKQLCYGASFKPFVKSGLSQSLGPMTQACHLALSRDDQYGTKWEQAFIRCFNYIPDVEAIARFIKASPASECKACMTHLASIAMLVGGREQRRVTFPLSAIVWLLSKTTTEAPPDGKGAPITKTEFNEDYAKALDFSGKGAFFAYYKLMTENYQFTLNLSNQSLSEQALFHMMFGTYVEDFGILSAITTKKVWNKREDFNAVFETLKASAPKNPQAVSHSPLGMNYYSKMAGATLVKFAAKTTSATNAAPMFSGFRTRKFTNKMKEVCSSGGESVSSVTSLRKAEAALSQYHSFLTQKTEMKDFEAGTVEWVSMDSFSDGMDNATTNVRFQETGELYWE